MICKLSALRNYLWKNLRGTIITIGLLGFSLPANAENHDDTSKVVMPEKDEAKMSMMTMWMPDGPYMRNRADGFAPIGVMNSHVHKKGHWMFGYRFMYMDMGQNYEGDSEVSVEEILNDDFLVTPTSMIVIKHMFSLMYGVTENFTLMAGVPYVEKEMTHQIGGPPGFPLQNNTFTINTNGIGDGRFSGIYQVLNEDHQDLIVSLALSVPFGSINRTAEIPLPPPNGSDPVVPYPMQIGSGSYGLIPSVTYNGQAETFSWGGQLQGTFWLNDNSADYRLGDQFSATTWIAKLWTHWVSTSFRLAYDLWGNIDGADSRIAQNSPIPGLRTVSTAQPNLRGGQRLSALFGVNFLLPKPDWWGVGFNRIAVEGGIPVYQNLSGPQLGSSWQLTAGWQVAW